MDADSQRDPVDALYRQGRQEFDAMVDGGGSRLDALFRAVPALGELAVGTPPPRPPREIVLSACRRVREGEDEAGVDESAAARLRPAAELVATAIGAEQVVVVCREQGGAAPALLLGTTRDGRLETLTAYTPETADRVG